MRRLWWRIQCWWWDRPTRCSVGIHRSSFDLHHMRSYMDPGEPAWACRDCGEEVFPVRLRILIWFEEHPPYRWYLHWESQREYERYMKHGEETGEW